MTLSNVQIPKSLTEKIDGGLTVPVTVSDIDECDFFIRIADGLIYQKISGDEIANASHSVYVICYEDDDKRLFVDQLDNTEVCLPLPEIKIEPDMDKETKDYKKMFSLFRAKST